MHFFLLCIFLFASPSWAADSYLQRWMFETESTESSNSREQFRALFEKEWRQLNEEAGGNRPFPRTVMMRGDLVAFLNQTRVLKYYFKLVDPNFLSFDFGLKTQMDHVVAIDDLDEPVSLWNLCSALSDAAAKEAASKCAAEMKAQARKKK